MEKVRVFIVDFPVFGYDSDNEFDSPNSIYEFEKEYEKFSKEIDVIRIDTINVGSVVALWVSRKDESSTYGDGIRVAYNVYYKDVYYKEKEDVEESNPLVSNDGYTQSEIWEKISRRILSPNDMNKALKKYNENFKSYTVTRDEKGKTHLEDNTRKIVIEDSNRETNCDNREANDNNEEACSDSDVKYTVSLEFKDVENLVHKFHESEKEVFIDEAVEKYDNAFGEVIKPMLSQWFDLIKIDNHCIRIEKDGKNR